MIAFVLALCGLAFGYGVAVMRLKIFPYRTIVNAEAAFHALRGYEDDALMANALRLDAAAPATPVVRTLDPAAGTERLLVTGGPYQMMRRCPKFGCMAWVIDRKGAILHSWEVDLDALYAGMPKVAGRTKPGNFYPQGLALQRDGSLVMTLVGFNTYPYQIGIAKISRTGAILWKRWDHNHHWMATDTAGQVYAPGMHFLRGQKYFGPTMVETRCPTQVMAETINVYAPGGALVRQLDMLTLLERGGWPGLLYGFRDGCDPVHLNSIDLATPAVAAKLAGVEAGDLLVSLREASAVMVLGKADGRIKRLVAGRTAAQHSPKFLPDGSVLVFDNLGGDRARGGSRVVRLNLDSGVGTTVFPRPGDSAELPFYSDNGGHIEISPDGRRAMVTGKEPGRAIEIDVATGKPLWSLRSGMDIAPYLKTEGIDAPTTRAWFKLWGVYFIGDDVFTAAGLGTP